MAGLCAAVAKGCIRQILGQRAIAGALRNLSPGTSAELRRALQSSRELREASWSSGVSAL
eukprot:15479283-Alexandrium_andersonii.AAC.1